MRIKDKTNKRPEYNKSGMGNVHNIKQAKRYRKPDAQSGIKSPEQYTRDNSVNQ